MSLKILWVSDSPDSPTGQGSQTLNICTGLNATKEFECVCIGSGALKREGVYTYKGIRIYPSAEIINIPLIRNIASKERPDFIVFFADPRLVASGFHILEEFRPQSKLLFYHLWDNYPLPQFNVPFYDSVDAIVCATKFTQNILAQLPIATPVYSALHGIDPAQFHPLTDAEKVRARKDLLNEPELENIEFTIFWNNRAFFRKRPGDLLRAYSMFTQQVGVPTLLLMRTRLQPTDPAAEDILGYRSQFLGGQAKIFGSTIIPTSELNALYNLSDITLSISKAEGFGLSIAESLMCEVPVCVTQTGGMTEQVIDETGNTFGFLMPPDLTELTSGPNTPYIFNDYVSVDQIVNTLLKAFHMKKMGGLSALGKLGRDHVLKYYTKEICVKSFSDILLEVYKAPMKPPVRSITL